MSVFSSLCHVTEHHHKVDVAYSMTDPEIRLIIWEDEDGNEATAYLTLPEAEHIIGLMINAIVNATRGLLVIYEYECPGCGDVRQIERKMTDPEETYICDNCHSTFMRKWSSPAVTFKGQGFYSTDNRK